MQRFNRFKIIVAILALVGLNVAYGQKPDIFVSGKIEPGEVMVFLKDNNYIINKSLTVGGTLIIEPGTTVYFNPNSSLIDSTGGRIIADGLASAVYNPNPILAGTTRLNPDGIAGSNSNPEDLIGGGGSGTFRPYANFCDLNYFLHGYNDRGAFGVAPNVLEPVVDTAGRVRDLTIHEDKYDHIFSVVLDTVNRRLINLEYDNNTTNFAGATVNQDVRISYEQALLFHSSRMNEDPATDVNLLTRPWRRTGDPNDPSTNPSITPERIRFIGQPANNFSREWGHIVVLPGARAAFFRNVDFEGFKKDTTVDNEPSYLEANNTNYPWAQGNVNPDWKKINNDIRIASNGSGGVITSFSTRTWVLGCNFTNNQSRFNGGAVQFLQAPAGLPLSYNADPTLDFIALKNALGTYSPLKNPAVTNPDGSDSFFNTDVDAGIPAIDRIDSPNGLPEIFSDLQRMAYDDGRVSIYLGRFRNNKFENNKVTLANTILKDTLGVTLVTDDVNADYAENKDYANHAYGGAIYLSGRAGDENRKIEIGIGINDGIYIDEDASGTLEADEYFEFEIADRFEAINNRAENWQSDDDSKGARGGAIYLGDYTALIVAGNFTSNEAAAPYFLNIESGLSAANYAQGGAIFTENTYSRLQVIGGPDREAILNRAGDPDPNPTVFASNEAGAGGAIYNDDNSDRIMSPVIGGFDNLIKNRDKGFNILFQENRAWGFGGAVYTARNFRINGAGGVNNNQLLGYGGKFPVRFLDNSAGLAGGAIFNTIPDSLTNENEKNIIVKRASFRRNVAGYRLDELSDDPPYDIRLDVRGGGAIYIFNADMNVVQGSEFIENVTFNGNGGAIAQIQPTNSTNKFFVSDLDEINYINGVGRSYGSVNGAFTWDASVPYAADVRMLTRFIGNRATAEDDVIASESGSGTTQRDDRNRRHKTTDLNENGVGLGGGIYILDVVAQSQIGRADSVHFNRVRMQENNAYTGAVVYSDNYDLKMVFNRSLITGNEATSDLGALQNLITGPIRRDGNGDIERNNASHDLVGAIIYGEVQGPLPSNIYSEAANSIYNNNARFLIRLPDAPDTKGALAGTTGLGDSGTDTLRGNYWGQTQANIDLDINNNFGGSFINATPETFFVAGPRELGEDIVTLLPFKNNWETGDPAIQQGPFESKGLIAGPFTYTYEPIPLRNGDDENTAAENTIPEKYLFSGKIYDIYDKGTDIKAADYSQRRMSPIEDFAVGIPRALRTFNDVSLPSNGKVVKRFTRDPFINADDSYNELYDVLFKEYSPNTDGNYYHPIGNPLYLEAQANYEGLIENSNDDPNLLNETVFFVMNETTGDYIRTNFKQVSEEAPNREIFRARVELVPDQSDRFDPQARRTAEGLFNVGVGRELLLKLYQDPYTEDGATLPGRKYDNAADNFGSVTGDLFSNRRDIDGDGFDEFGKIGLPVDNYVDDYNGNTGDTIATFFAGERYGALPVNVGDTVSVISRTDLWQNNVDPALTKGLRFAITSGVEQPQFAGDIVQLRDVPTFEYRLSEENDLNDDDGKVDTIEIVEFRNTVFVREDRLYPAENDAYGVDARDSILSITAIDNNNYYDPRALLSLSSNSFTYLTYGWELQPNSGVENWIVVDTTYAGNGVPRDGALGYHTLEGTPTNPYVVPGGETVKVYAESFPPHFRTIDSLKTTFGWDSDNDTLDALIETYPDYFFSQAYNSDDARYLQQDTVNMVSDGSYRAEYEFKIFVVDSLPTFIHFTEGANPEFGRPFTEFPGTSGTLTRNNQDGSVIDTQAVYVPSDRFCFSQDPEETRLFANLTDKLRFQIDLNTDDEIEDEWAQKVHNWDFRYGRSAYAFKAVHINGGDTSTLDDSYYFDQDGNQIPVVNQTRPIWMSDEFIYAYGSETMTDPLLNHFTTSGQLNVRVDSADAYRLLRSGLELNGSLNLDTSFTIVATDGHGGRADLNFDILINVPPVILNQNLLEAKEDFFYNPQLIDTLRKINIYDANFNQTHTYEIIRGQYDDGIDRDGCFPEEAGQWELGIDFENTTADWLEIHPVTGVLFGTPSILDAPRFDDVVSVLVTDSEGLTTVRRFDLRVDSTQHAPEITTLPPSDCYDAGQEYRETFTIDDLDLERIEEGYLERLNIQVIEPQNGFTVVPNIINGSVNGGVSRGQEIEITSANLVPVRDADGKMTITIRVTDRGGNETIKSFRINVSDEVNFLSALNITNQLGATETLYWGTAQDNNPTTGDGKDGDQEIGRLDTNFCEFELPPLPPVDVFDARWTLPAREGIIRNVYPSDQAFDVNTFIYKATIQPGGENGNVSSRYPLTITWNSDDIPATDDGVRNPDGTSWWLMDGFSGNGEFFRINMKTGEAPSLLEILEENNGVYTLTITNSIINSLLIVADITSDVEDGLEFSNSRIVSVTPNPISENSIITYDIKGNSHVTVDVLDIYGNVVNTLVNQIESGRNLINLNGIDEAGNNLSNGYYTLRLKTDNNTTTMPIRIVK